jgi:O-antigen/teichoic acid export membrane protein
MSGNIAYVGYSQGITILINLFFGPTMNAAASIANQAGSIINQFSGSFQTAMNPQITKNYAKNQFKEMHDLVFRSSKFSYFLMLIFVVPLFFEANLLLSIWLKEVPEHSVYFMRLGLFISMFTAVRNPLIVSAQANGDIKKYQFVVIPILLLITPVSYVILKLGGIPETTSYVMLVIIIIAVFASAYMLRNMIHLNFMDFVKRVMLKIFLVTIAAFCLPTLVYILMDEGLIRFLVLGTIATLSCLTSIYKIGLTASERTFVLNMITSKLPFKKFKK